MARTIDYIATAKGYDWTIGTRAEFEAAPARERHPGLLERALQAEGAYVLWDKADNEDGYMLVGGDPVALAKELFEQRLADSPFVIERDGDVVVRYFPDTGNAYDACNSDESIRTGDVLVIESESVVGISLEAWPTAITSEHGEFHQPGATMDWSSVKKTAEEGFYNLTDSLRVAKAIAAEKGFI